MGSDTYVRSFQGKKIWDWRWKSVIVDENFRKENYKMYIKGEILWGKMSQTEWVGYINISEEVWIQICPFELLENRTLKMWVAVPVPWLQDEQEAPVGGEGGGDAKKL